MDAQRAEKVRPVEAPREPSLREWVKDVASRARGRMGTPRGGRRGKREKELFVLRAQHVKALFGNLEQITSAINREAGRPLIEFEKALNPKNLGGIEVPDRARLVLKFLERRVELAVKPLVNIDGRPVPVGALASASVILYDPADPEGTDWYDLMLREDGTWVRKASDSDSPQPPLGEKEIRRLVEWLVG